MIAAASTLSSSSSASGAVGAAGAAGAVAVRMPGGFSRLPNHLVDRGLLNDLRPGALRVFLFMLRLADDQWRCWPSQGTIAQRTGQTTRSVQYALLELIEAKLIARERRGRPGRSSLYRLTFADIPGVATATPLRSPSGNRRHEARTFREGRNDVRKMSQPASGASRTPLHTTQTQDSDPTRTHSRDVAVATERRDVCVDSARGEERTDGPASTGRVGRLLALGISETTALQLLATHVPSQVDCALDNAAFLAAHDRLSNAAGYVIDALRRNYGPLPERLEADRREARKRRQREAGARQIADTERRVRDERIESDRAAEEALRFVKAMDESSLAKATEAVLQAMPSAARAVMQGRDARTSRSLAMLVREHALRQCPSPSPSHGQESAGFAC